MKRKKLFVYIALIVAVSVALTMLPVQYLYALESLYEPDNYGGNCNTDEHYVEYYLDDGNQAGYRLDVDNYMPPGWNSSSRFFAIELHNNWNNTPLFTLYSFSRSCSSPAIWGAYRGCWTKDNWAQINEHSTNTGADIVWVRFWYTGDYRPCYPPATPAPEPEPWVRGDREMVCYQVWVNDDGCFEFVFWYEYADNNWVRIYEMNADGTVGEMVYEIDMDYGDASFEACLGEGMFWVETYHDQPDPLQEFMIGNP
jgi:hypothetical protein